MRSLASLGYPSLVCALVFAAGAAGLAAVGARRRRRDLTSAALRAMAVAAAATIVAAGALVTALFAHDFSVAYIAQYSSRSLGAPYLLTALWGGMDGSLLFWTVLLTAFAAIALSRAHLRDTALAGWATVILAGISSFFLVLLLVPADPFARLATPPADGSGLNPLLQSPGMVAHPPLLYTGFVGFSIPFAFAVAALITGRVEDSWWTWTRRWTLFAWSALSIGIVIGGAWAYTELGWGGYWAWDPVENASLLPWLTATAYLHSVVIQERRRMFKAWNVSLIVLTYSLALFGTFLTRSGLLSSIHTFSEGPVGRWFLPFFGAVLLGGVLLVLYRADRLRSEHTFDSLLSRESVFLANNVLFVAAAVTVLWGTIYPIVAEALTGERLSVGPPFFDSVFIPIGLAILLLAGAGPLVSWRRMSPRAGLRVAALPLAAGAITAAVLAALGVRSPGALTAFALCAFTAVSVIAEFERGSRVYRHRDHAGLLPALVRTVARNRRRYAGYIVHLGVVLIVIGLAGSAFRTESARVLEPGSSMSVGSYRLTFEGARTHLTPEAQVHQATVAVSRGGRRIATLHPRRDFHLAQQQWQSEVAIRSTPAEDLYLVITNLHRDGAAELRAFVNPLTMWIWIGAAVMLVGMTVLLTEPRRARAEAAAPARERAAAEPVGAL